MERTEQITYVNMPIETYEQIQSDLTEIKELVKTRVEVTQKSHYTTFEVRDRLGIGNTKLHELMSCGILNRIKRGRRVYITKESIERYLATPTNK